MHNLKSNTMTRFAFFDVDDTVISMKSMFSFIDIYFTMYPNKTLQTQFNNEMQSLISNDISWEIANKIYYSYFTHFPITQVESACDQWFTTYSSNKDEFFHSKIIQRLQQHQQQGVECVFVSGSFRELLQPIADELSITYILSINLERRKSSYTGDIIPPQTIGTGKAQAISQFLFNQHAEAEDCYAYGDDISDVPMLEIVGYPRAVRGGRRLEGYAQERGWEVISPR